MFATVFYWCVVVVACAWSLVWSLIYLAKHENGNLWIFAIINALGLIALGILYWIYSSQDNQWYWFASKQLDIAGLVYVFYFYIVWVVFQAIAGITKKSTINLTTKPTEDTQFLMGTVCTIKVNNKNKSAALDDGLDRIKKLADEITINQKGSEVDKIIAEASQSFR